ncbi:hypothetical protein C8039_03740 [Halogeometricum sp. wsp3]|nr:hypothetical protein C8039_03740 [Halogeometricum sp. wsp3]
MADEFIKGLGIFTAAGLGWMVLAGWYRTSSFESTQLTGELTIEEPTTFDRRSVEGASVFGAVGSTPSGRASR